MKPNLILITVDSLRKDHLGCYGYEKDITPTIDELSEEGLTFKKAFSSGPNTPYSFPSLFSSTFGSMYPKASPLSETSGTYAPRLEGGKTLAEVLKCEGYSTAGFHSNPLLSSYYKYNRGFEIFGEYFQKAPQSELSEKSNEFIERLKFLGNHLISLKPFHKIFEGFKIDRNKRINDSAFKMNKRALNWIKNSSEPFFLWIHYMDVHFPYIPLKGALTEILQADSLCKEINRVDKNSESFSNDKIHRIINFYDSKIEEVDRELRLFLDNLRSIEKYSDTYVVLTSDHGEGFGEHGSFFHGSTSWIKPYEELINIPLIIYGSNLSKKTVNNLVSLLDFAPSILDLLNLSIPEAWLGGPSFFSNSNHGSYCEDGIISESGDSVGKSYAYRGEKWKLILTKNKERTIKELYNLEKDPKETRNLSGERVDKTQDLENKIQKHIHIGKKLKLTKKEKLKIRESVRNFDK